MGCGGSKEVPNFNDNYNQNIEINSTSKESSSHTQKNDRSRIDSPNSIIDLQQDENHVQKKVVKKTVPRIVQKRAIKTKLSGDSRVKDAWAVGHGVVSKNPGPVRAPMHTAKQSNVVVQDDFENESEYGREGIAFSSVNYESSHAKYQRLDGQHGIGVGQGLAKKRDSDIPFDPSTLVDIEKFKAVNAPKAVKSSHKRNTESSTVAHGDKRGQAGSLQVSSPSNYQEFYDEDEKALMESIEHGFTESTYTALPGEVV